MLMPGRKYQAGGGLYRYGFNGQEKSNEVTEGNYTAEFWEYDSRIGRRWNVDPVYKHSPYECFGSNPIWFMDRNGADSTVYLFSHQSKDKGSSANGPSSRDMKKILKNVKKINEANGINNLKYKIVSEDDFNSGKLKLDPSDAILGVTGIGFYDGTEGESYINANGNTLPGKTTGKKFGFPFYSTYQMSQRALNTKSDPISAISFGVAHEILHQYLAKADKVFFGDNPPSGDHYDMFFNLNATGYKLATYTNTNRINQSTILTHTNQNTIGYIAVWQRIYINGYFKAINAGVSTAGNDAGKESSFKYIFNSSGYLFKMQMQGLLSFRNSMVGDKPK
jgi:hypothetical protein